MIVKTLANSIRQYKKQSILTPLFVSIEVIMESIIPFIMAKMIDNMSGATVVPIIKYSIILVALSIFSFIAGFLSGNIGATASCGFAKNLREDLFFKVQKFAFQDIDKFSTASLVTRLTTDVTNVQNAYQMVIRIAVRVPLMLIFSMAMSFSINWKIALIFLSTVPIVGIILAVILKKVMPYFNRIFKKYDKMNNNVQENINGIRVVKSYARENYEIGKFNKTSDEVNNDFTKAEKIIALSSPFMMFFIYLIILIISFFGAKMIINSVQTELTAGELASLINYGVQILISMMMLSFVFVMISISAESSKRIVEIINQEPSLANSENVSTEIPNGSIEFKNVYFKYSERANKYALSDINLIINSGETIGILGGTGSAKTTLIQLIPRLYDTTKGEVFVGGKNVTEYDIEALRNQAVIVLQKNLLFAGTIKENLRWGNKGATDEELINVCKMTQSDEFIEQFPERYDTYVEQGGSNLSGGQKQRLCIARALLKNPKILIFDDSTSAVDTKTDSLIKKCLNNELPNATKIIIAQRVASIEKADKIIVMEGGKIIENGTHKELLSKNGFYKEIYLSQTRGKEAKNAN
ncbi:MAG: ABC transporter ATP-binding protein [Clostridia bacterium]